MSTSASPSRLAVVLAAGKGTRMKSARPKVLHEAGGRPLLAWVLDAARSAGCERIAVVVGHGAEAVRAAFPDPDILWVEQREQRGTGHALAQVGPHLAAPATLLVLSGDVPLLSAGTLRRLAELAGNCWGAMAVATLEAPGSLGRVLARADGSLERIVEAADASPEELAIREINAGIYALPAPAIFDYLRRLRPDNAKGELYLTDALGLAVGDGRRIALLDLEEPAEAWGVNDRADLAQADAWLGAQVARDLMGAGVTLLAPERTHVGAGVETCGFDGQDKHRTEIGAGAFVDSDTMLAAPVRVGTGTTSAAGSVITQDVPDGALAVERAEQRNYPGWAERRKRRAVRPREE